MQTRGFVSLLCMFPGHVTDIVDQVTVCRDVEAHEENPSAQLPIHRASEYDTSVIMDSKPTEMLYALVDYDDAYVQPLILAALKALVPEDRLGLLTPPPDDDISLSELVPGPASKILQIAEYERIDFAYAAAHPAAALVNSYVIRKALIRKHFLSATVDHWLAKHPGSVLGRHVRRSEAFEVDYAEFLDDALVEAFDLRASLERNEGAGPAAAQREDEGVTGREADGQGEGGLLPAASREWWILKPGMSDRGQGIKLFSTTSELQAIFDQWEAEQPDSEEEEDDDDGGADTTQSEAEADRGRDYITTSHLRHFVAQPYIHPPLLHGGRKFHIRVYVVCVGALRVYVFREMLALFAAKPYRPPWETADPEAHLTNTCLQGEGAAEGSVRRFWDLETLSGGDGEGRGVADEADPLSSPSHPSRSTSAAGITGSESVFAQICAVTGDVFEAAAREMLVHFQPLAHAFEVFGLDFLVDAAGTAWLLEANAFPDFKQTGDGLRAVVAEFWAGALRLAVGPFAGLPDVADGGGETGMVLVRDLDLGRR